MPIHACRLLITIALDLVSGNLQAEPGRRENHYSALGIGIETFQQTPAVPPSPCPIGSTGLLLYHAVREAVAAGIITVMWVKSEDNLADICTKIMSGMTLKRILSYLLIPRRLKQTQ